MPVLGLVGGIGAGKSTTAAAFASQGALVLDADAIGHALLDQRPAREAVVDCFGPTILDPDQPERVDRKAFGRLVFGNLEALRSLEAILHPRIRVTVEKAIARAQRGRRTYPLIVLDAALLYEADWAELCDLVAFVEAAPEVCRDRMAARGWSPAEIEARTAAQWTPERKRELAQGVIRNGGDPEAFQADVTATWNRLRRRPSPRTQARTRPESASTEPAAESDPDGSGPYPAS